MGIECHPSSSGQTIRSHSHREWDRQPGECVRLIFQLTIYSELNYLVKMSVLVRTLGNRYGAQTIISQCSLG